LHLDVHCTNLNHYNILFETRKLFIHWKRMVIKKRIKIQILQVNNRHIVPRKTEAQHPLQPPKGNSSMPYVIFFAPWYETFILCSPTLVLSSISFKGAFSLHIQNIQLVLTSTYKWVSSIRILQRNCKKSTQMKHTMLNKDQNTMKSQE